MSNLVRVLCLATILACLPARADDVRELILAARLDNPSAVKRLLSSGASPNAIDPISGEPALVAALREGATGAARALMDHPKIDLERQAGNGNTALMMAAFKGNAVAVKELLARGAMVNRPGWAPLHYAAVGGDPGIAAMLLRHQAAIDAESPGKQTALMLAAREGNEDVVDLLLTQGANAALRNTDNMSAADLASKADKPRIVARLKAHLAR